MFEECFPGGRAGACAGEFWSHASGPKLLLSPSSLFWFVQAFKSNPLIGKDYERVVPEGCALDSNTDIYAQQVSLWSGSACAGGAVARGACDSVVAAVAVLEALIEEEARVQSLIARTREC